MKNQLSKNSNMHKFSAILSKYGILCGNVCKVIHNLLRKNGEKVSYTRSYARYPRKREIFPERTFCEVVIKLITLEKYYRILLTFMKLKILAVYV